MAEGPSPIRFRAGAPGFVQDALSVWVRISWATQSMDRDGDIIIRGWSERCAGINLMIIKTADGQIASQRQRFIGNDNDELVLSRLSANKPKPN
jgi:hypothetical protein